MTITTIAECQRGQRATWNAELDKRAVDAAAATTVAANDKVPSAEWETTSSMKERETERQREEEGWRVEVAESGAWPDEATERKLFGTAENAELWATGDNNNNSNNK